MTKPALEFEAREVKTEVARRVFKDEREFVTAPDFTRTTVWLCLRTDVLEAKDNLCTCCGSDGVDRGGLNVDHKRNRRDFPQLALLWGNLQVLCGACNQGKGNRYNTDWEKRRPARDAVSPYTPSDEVRAQLKTLAPGWDPNKLLSDYSRFRRRKRGEAVHSPDKAFLGWVAKVTKGLPPPPGAGAPAQPRRAGNGPQAGLSTARITGRRRPFGGRKKPR